MTELGTDFDCSDDITDDWAVAESEEIAYLQACYRRLVMLGLWYDSDYGLGAFRFLLESGLTVADVQAAIRRELLKDERTHEVATQVLNTTITVTVTPHVGPYRLTFTLDRQNGALLDASIG